MADIDSIRTPGNWADWLILIDDPPVVYTARAGTPPLLQTDWTIAFTDGSGTLGDCLADMTLLIGSSAGAMDKGVARLRKAPVAGIFYIGADPSLQVETGDYLTVIDDFELFAKHSFGALLDVEQVYSDQFDDFTPLPWFNGRVAVIKAGETITFDASRSWAPGAVVDTFAWDFTGATSYDGEDTATPEATYETSGRYRVALTVTADAKSYTGYGYVYVLGELLSAETDALIDDPESDSLAGAVCKVEMLDRPTIRDGARAVVFSRDWYEGVEQSFGPVAGRENILIDGRILGETILRNPRSDTVEFEIGGPIQVLAQTACLSVGVVDTSLPTDDGATLPAWSKMSGLTVRKMLAHLAVNLSTIARTTDFWVEDWEGWACPKLSGEGEDLYQLIRSIAERAALNVTADRCGRMFVERDAQLYPLDDRTADIPVVMTLTDADWEDELNIVRRQIGEVSLAEAEGEIFAGGILTKVGGRSPGNQPSRYGRSESLDELYVPSQAAVLELAGLLAGAMNAEIAAITLRMVHNNRLMDVAPRQFVNVTVDGEVLRCIPRNVTSRREDGTGRRYTELELEPEGGQWPAVAIEYPGEEDPPVEPPTEPPSDPPMPPDEPPTPPEIGDADAVVVTSDDVRITGDLDEASPTWTSIISGGPSAPVDSDLSAFTNDLLMVIEDNAVWRCDGVTGTPAWTKVWDADTDFDGSEFGGLLRVRMAYNALGVAYVLGWGDDGETTKPFVLRTTNNGTTWNQNWIDEEITSRDYTVTYRSGTLVRDGGGTDYVVIEHPRIGDDQTTYNPWALAIRIGTVAGVTTGNGFVKDANTIHDYDTSLNLAADSTIWGNGNWLLGNSGLAGEAYMDDYFGDGGDSGAWIRAAGIDRNMPKESNRVNVRIGSNFGAFTYSTLVESWVFWNKPSPIMPKALDVAPMNSNWVYVGLTDKILRSEDGGFTWTVMTEDYGANDILVDPQLAGVIYVWNTDGDLVSFVGGVEQAAVLSESAVELPLRLARSVNLGRLWGLQDAADLERRENASWTTQDTGLANATGLHAYLGERLIYLDAADIYFSGDGGGTISAKKGGWAEYAGGINAHLMRSE